MLGVLRRAVLKPGTAGLGEVSSMCLLERMQFCQECTDTVFPLRPFAFLEHSVISYKRPSIITSLGARHALRLSWRNPAVLRYRGKIPGCRCPQTFPAITTLRVPWFGR